MEYMAEIASPIVNATALSRTAVRKQNSHFRAVTSLGMRNFKFSSMPGAHRSSPMCLKYVNRCHPNPNDDRTIHSLAGSDKNLNLMSMVQHHVSHKAFGSGSLFMKACSAIIDHQSCKASFPESKQGRIERL